MAKQIVICNHPSAASPFLVRFKSEKECFYNSKEQTEERIEG
jgi:hypothetical protein